MAIRNKLVYRDGKPVVKKESDRPGVSVDYHDDGKPKEKKMTEKERLRRIQGQKSGQKKRNAKMKNLQTKRQKTLEAKERNQVVPSENLAEQFMSPARWFYHGQVWPDIETYLAKRNGILFVASSYLYALTYALTFHDNVIEKIKEKIGNPNNPIKITLKNNQFTKNGLGEYGYIFKGRINNLNIFNAYNDQDWQKFEEKKNEFLEKMAKSYGVDLGKVPPNNPFRDIEDAFNDSSFRETLKKKDWTLIKGKTGTIYRDYIIKILRELGFDGFQNYERSSMNKDIFSSVGIFTEGLDPKIKFDKIYEVKIKPKEKGYSEIYIDA